MQEKVVNNERYEVYLIENLINSKKYIGITTQGHKKRFKQHIKDAKNKRYNSALHHAIRKYGIENFTIEVIEFADSWDELCEKETDNISKYDTYNTGYNLTLGGEGSKGCAITEDNKKKISEANKGRKRTKEANIKIIESQLVPVCQYTLKGEFIEEWDSALSASIAVNIYKQNIYACCSNRYAQTNGFIWKYSRDVVVGENLIVNNSNFYIKNNKVGQYDLFGNLIKIWDNTKDVLQYLGIKNRNKINDCIKNRINDAYGYKWSYV